MTDPLAPKSVPRIPDAEGGMEHAPLVYALVHALDRAITGEMVFRTPSGESHTVTFFEGAPVRVEPGQEGERIGDDLVAMDLVTEDALADALLRAASSRRRLGELLVHASAVDPDALTGALKLQTARRLALLADLPAASRFSLYFSARAEPEPHAPWAPLDMLLASVRAWKDRTRLHGTLRWLSNKQLHLSPASDLHAVMLTSREREAVALMQREAVSLKALYASVGKGLSSLLYTLAVTRQFSFTGEKGPPMGRRKETDLVRDAVQVAVPMSPVILSVQETEASEPAEDEAQFRGSLPPPPEAPVPPPPAPVPAAYAPPPPPPSPAAHPPAAPPPASPAAPARRRVSIPAGPDVTGPAVPVRIPPPPPSVHVPLAPPAPPAAAPPVAAPFVPRPSPFPAPPAPPAAAPRPSSPPAKYTEGGRPPARIPEQKLTHTAGARMSDEFRRAEEAARLLDFETAERILVERCSETDAAEPDYSALSAWVKANLHADDLTSPLNDLTFLLMAHTTCEGALYYRGLLHKRLGKEKAALRDFVTLAKTNPGHAGALSEIKSLRDAGKRP